MKLVTNVRRVEKETVELIAPLINLPVFFDTAYDIFGDPIDDCIAIYTNDDEEKPLDRFFQAMYEFERQYKEKLKDEGYDISKLFSKPIYFGCEEDYFAGEP